MFDPSLVREIRQVYTEDFLDFDEPQSLKELCETRGIAYKLVKEIADRENWDGMRFRNKQSFKTELAKQQDEIITKQALDVAGTIEKTLKANLKFLYNQLPQVKNILENRLDDMTTKEVLSYFRLLMQIEKDTNALLERAYKYAQGQGEASAAELMDILKNPKEISKVIDGISEEDMKADESELAEAFRSFDED